ncbi:MAG: DUF433 domain-containing protein [Bacteroidia bacterium]
MIQNFQYIVSNPAILKGKPCLAGTRISIDVVLEWLASGATLTEIVQKYPHLKIEALQEALLYAAQLFKNEVIREIKIVA